MEIGKNLTEELLDGAEVDPQVGTLHALDPEARSAPGTDPEDFTCDWSADESDVEVVAATSASKTEVKQEEEVKDECMEPDSGEEGERVGEQGPTPMEQDAVGAAVPPAGPVGVAAAKGVEVQG